MSVVSVTNVDVLRNPCALLEPFEFDVSFESLESLKEDLVWRLIYVGDAEDKKGDQELDCVVLGPIPRGCLRFTFVADAPDYSKIRKEDIPGITIVLLTASYREQEFVRIGWYIHNVFASQEYRENPPDVDDLELRDLVASLQRVVLADEPRVTKFNIQWDNQEVDSNAAVTFIAAATLQELPCSVTDAAPKVDLDGNPPINWRGEVEVDGDIPMSANDSTTTVDADGDIAMEEEARVSPPPPPVLPTAAVADVLEVCK